MVHAFYFSDKRFFDLISQRNGADLFCGLCINVELVDGSETSSQNAYACIQIPSSYESHRTDIFESLVGWLNNLALDTWERRDKLLVSKQAFTNQLHAILDGLKRKRRRERPGYEITLDENAIANNRDSTFVRQIDLVTEDEEWQTDAIKDYLRCIIEKCRLCKDGMVTGDDWSDFTDRLGVRWKAIFSRNNRLCKESEEEKGFRTMSDVLDPEYNAELAGEQTTQPYLIRGSYHRLSDEKKIGWHPRYQTLLAEGEVSDGRTV